MVIFQVSASLVFAQLLTEFLWKRNYDPDMYAMPLHSSVVDLIGQLLLIVCFEIVSLMGQAVEAKRENPSWASIHQLILHRIPVYNKFLVFERTVVRIDMTLIMIVRKIRFVWLMLPDREVVSRECFDFFPRPQTIRAHRHRRLSQQLWNKVDVLKQLACFPRSTLLFTWSNVFFVPLKPPKHCHRLFLSNTILQSAIKIFGE